MFNLVLESWRIYHERKEPCIGSNVDVFEIPNSSAINGQRFCAKEVHDEHGRTNFMSCRADRNAGRTSPMHHCCYEAGNIDQHRG